MDHHENGNGINLSSHSRGANGNGKLGLPYRIADHKGHWALWFSAFLFDGCVLPLILFYALWFGTGLSGWTIFALITSLSFWTSYHKWFSRGYRLLKKAPTYRPLTTHHRWTFDTSYYVLSLALGIMILELVIATSTKDVKVRVIAMAPPSVLYTIAVYMLLQNSLHVAGVRCPVRLSSVKRGERVPPPMFTVMEDVFCVDGCHEGRPAREAMMALYAGSAKFRSACMLWSWIWGMSCAIVAVVLSIVVGVTSETTCFGVCYGVSYPFIVVLALVTAGYMERMDARGGFGGEGNGVKVMEGT